MNKEIKIYVACLSSYNNGILHGRWIDATLGRDHIFEEVTLMLAESKQQNAEEWAIHDFEGFGKIEISEYESFERIAEIADMLSSEKYDIAVIEAALSNLGKDSSKKEIFEYLNENYLGCFSSLEEYGRDYLESTGDLSNIPESLMYFFNFDAYAKDLELSGIINSFEEKYNKIHIFNQN